MPRTRLRRNSDSLDVPLISLPSPPGAARGGACVALTASLRIERCCCGVNHAVEPRFLGLFVFFNCLQFSRAAEGARLDDAADEIDISCLQGDEVVRKETRLPGPTEVRESASK